MRGMLPDCSSAVVAEGWLYSRLLAKTDRGLLRKVTGRFAGLPDGAAKDVGIIGRQ
jgi:hypothetical protein